MIDIQLYNEIGKELNYRIGNLLENNFNQIASRFNQLPINVY